MGKYQSGLETPFIAAKVSAKLPGVYNTYNYVPLVPDLYRNGRKIRAGRRQKHKKGKSRALSLFR